MQFLTSKIKFNKHVYVFLILLRASIYWIAWAIFNRDMPWSVAMMYRERGHDVEYFPFLASLLKTGVFDASDYLYHGSRIVSFPFGSVWLHSLSYNVFGIFGIILADSIVAITVFFLIAKLLKLLGIREFISDTISLFIVIGTTAKLAGLSAVFHQFLGVKSDLVEFLFYISFVFLSAWSLIKKKSIPFILSTSGFLLLFSITYTNWEYFTWRFPRPFVTEIYFLGFLILLIRLHFAENIFLNKTYWALLGLVSAFLVQSEIYQFFYCGLMLALLTLYRVLNGFVFIEALKCLGSFLAPFLSLSIPFFIQRLHETPDVPRRFGLLSESRFHLYFHEVNIHDIYLATLIGAMLVFVYRFHKEKQDISKRIIIILFAVFICYFSMTLFPVFTGKVIETGHFYSLLAAMTTLVVLASSGLLLNNLVEQKSVKISKNIIYSSIVLIALVTIFKNAHKTITFDEHTRSDFKEYRFTQDYRKNFSELVKFLSSDTISKDQSIGTYDMQVVHWWGAYKRGKMFTPAQFASPLTDDELEDRFVVMGRLLNFKPDEFVDFLNQRMTTFFFFTCLKYQFIKGYIYSNWDDYTPEDQKFFWSTSEISMNPVIPISERVRLKNKFMSFLNFNLKHVPDIIVLQLHANLDGKMPDEKIYEQVYTNEIFRVFKKR